MFVIGFLVGILVGLVLVILWAAVDVENKPE